MNSSQKILISIVSSVLVSVSVWGQNLKPQDDPKYGDTPESRTECAGNLSTMSEFVKIKVYDYAYEPWRACFKNCPESSKNIYIQGKKIIVYKIENVKTDQEKEAYIDTLMLLYDQRIKYFGQEGKVLGKKGIDLLKYRRSAIAEANGYLKKSLELDKTKANASVAATYITTCGALFKANEMEADEMITAYISTMEYVDGMRQTPKTQKAREGIEKIFAESGAADCDALINIFTPKYEADPSNAELLNKITELLKQTNCQESDLFAQASESLFSIEPSAKAGANLAMVFASRNDFDKAVEYYNKAIELETDPTEKAHYYYQLAAIAMQRKNYSQVRKFGYEAIGLKADYGEAYILIGNAYAAGNQSCGSSNFTKATSFLAAVDKFEKAKSVDPTLTEEANRLISKYLKYYPNQEEAFFEGFTNGQSYKINCWINETTTIRTTK